MQRIANQKLELQFLRYIDLWFIYIFLFMQCTDRVNDIRKYKEYYFVSMDFLLLDMVFMNRRILAVNLFKMCSF